MIKEKVSAIIPAYNAEKTIQECIQAIASQIYPVDEIIVVNDCSKDATKEKVESLGLPHCRLLSHAKNSGVAKGRNTGIREAKGDYLWFVDADTIVQENCLEWLMEGFEKDNLIAIVSGPNPNPPEIKNIFTIMYEIISRFDYSHERGERFGWAIGANFCVKKKIAQQFPQDENLLSHQDRDYFLRVELSGYKLFFQPKAIGWHFCPRTNLRSYFRNAFKFGVYGTVFRFKNKPFASLSRYYPENIFAFLLIVPAIVIFTTLKPLFYNIKYKLKPFREILFAAPLLFLGQCVLGIGAIKGFYLFKKMIKKDLH